MMEMNYVAVILRCDSTASTTSACMCVWCEDNLMGNL